MNIVLLLLYPIFLGVATSSNEILGLHDSKQAERVQKVASICFFLIIGIALYIAIISENIENDSHKYVIFCILTVLASCSAGSTISLAAQSFLKDSSAPKEPTRIKGNFLGRDFSAELTKEKDGDGAYGGGKIIGVLERASITLILITGLHQSLIIIFTIKGLARYSEIKSGTLTAERFIIGTFASSLWAGLCALIPLLLVN